MLAFLSGFLLFSANIYGSSLGWLENTRMSTQPIYIGRNQNSIDNIAWVSAGPLLYRSCFHPLFFHLTNIWNYMFVCLFQGWDGYRGLSRFPLCLTYVSIFAEIPKVFETKYFLIRWNLFITKSADLCKNIKAFLDLILNLSKGNSWD